LTFSKICVIVIAREKMASTNKTQAKQINYNGGQLDAALFYFVRDREGLSLWAVPLLIFTFYRR